MDFNAYSSEVLEWLEGVRKNRGVDAEKTLMLCKNIRDYAREQDDEKLLGYAYYYSGETYYLLNDVDKLFRNLSCSLPYLEHSRQHGLLARAYNILAITSMNRGNAPFAMDYYLNARMYCEKYKLYDIGIIININIGMLYNNFGEYRQAEKYLEQAYDLLQKNKEIPEYYSYLLNIYIGLGNSCFYQEEYMQAQEYALRAKEACAGHMGELEQIAFSCFEARLCSAMGKKEERDRDIAIVQKVVDTRMPILDIFDDLYSYSEMLLDTGKEKEFWELVELLEKMAREAKIIYMQKRILTLKIRYYKRQEKNREYLQACGLFFELSEILEKENKYIMTCILDMRYTLEETNHSRKKMEKENRILLEQSQTDALTGIPNRYRLEQHAQKVFDHAVEEKIPVAVEILDIDYFKQYNDNYGHQKGDLCICCVAKEIQKLAEKDDIFCARYGGDEFILIYEGYSREAVVILTEKLKRSIRDLDMEHAFSAAQRYVSISQGICYDIPDEGRTMKNFLQKADDLLYQVKEENRGGICIGSCR